MFVESSSIGIHWSIIIYIYIYIIYTQLFWFSLVYIPYLFCGNQFHITLETPPPHLWPVFFPMNLPVLLAMSNTYIYVLYIYIIIYIYPFYPIDIPDYPASSNYILFFACPARSPPIPTVASSSH